MTDTLLQEQADVPYITKQNASDIARKSHSPTAKRKIPSHSQAIEIQHALHKAVKLLRDDLPTCDNQDSRARVATAIASVAKGWQSMTDQLRILSGKAAPGTLSPAERRAKAEAKRPAAKRDGPRAARPAPAAPEDSASKESLS